MHPGGVVRVGDTVRRPRPAGSEAVEALLVHLELVGFDASPRFLGIDELGRQVLTFIEGDSDDTPAWLHDDEANAGRLGELAAVLAALHRATADFVPPVGAEPRRPLPTPGPIWTHGDVGYANAVYREGRLVALIDWEFAAPADPLHGAGALLATSVRAPRPDAVDRVRRTRAVELAIDALVDGGRLSDADRRRLPGIAATVLDDAAAFATERGWLDEDGVDIMRWRADWFRSLDPAS